MEISFSKSMVEVSSSKSYDVLGSASLGGTYEQQQASYSGGKNRH
jgi:hypothetical protein